jgi:hypothetical protein
VTLGLEAILAVHGLELRVRDAELRSVALAVVVLVRRAALASSEAREPTVACDASAASVAMVAAARSAAVACMAGHGDADGVGAEAVADHHVLHLDSAERARAALVAAGRRAALDVCFVRRLGIGAGRRRLRMERVRRVGGRVGGIVTLGLVGCGTSLVAAFVVAHVGRELLRRVARRVGLGRLVLRSGIRHLVVVRRARDRRDGLLFDGVRFVGDVLRVVVRLIGVVAVLLDGRALIGRRRGRGRWRGRGGLWRDLGRRLSRRRRRGLRRRRRASRLGLHAARSLAMIGRLVRLRLLHQPLGHHVVVRRRRRGRIAEHDLDLGGWLAVARRAREPRTQLTELVVCRQVGADRQRQRERHDDGARDDQPGRRRGRGQRAPSHCVSLGDPTGNPTVWGCSRLGSSAT